jgi:uncharacterized protein DUF3800
MMLKAFVDDSGTGNPPVFVLAGFLARVNRWDGFTSMWDTAVIHGDPPIDYFKMHEAHARIEQFRPSRISVAERDARVTTCVSVIQQWNITPIRVVIPRAAYREVFYGRVSTNLDNPYWLAFYSILGNVLLGLEDNRDFETIDFVFDEPGTRSGKEYKVLVEGFEAFLENAPREVTNRLAGRPTHKDDKGLPPLQAADLYAWHVRRFYDEREQGRIYCDPVWLALSNIKGGLEVELDKERLASMLERMLKRNAEAGRVFPYQLPPKARKKALKEKRKRRQ